MTTTKLRRWAMGLFVAAIVVMVLAFRFHGSLRVLAILAALSTGITAGVCEYVATVVDANR